MFAPPGVDSSSSGEETTPPPSPIPQRVKPRFSFRSLFSPTSGVGSSTHHSRTLRKGKVKPPTNEEVKHSTPVEAAEADPKLPTDENDLLTPKKRVRIYAGELQSGERARGLTNNLGEGVRDSLSIKNQETILNTDNNRNDNDIGISEEVYMMLKRFTDEQKELEHAVTEQQEKIQIQPPTRTSSIPFSNLEPDDTPLRKVKAQAKAIPKPKPIITDTSPEDGAQLSPSPTRIHGAIRGGDADQSKPTDILLRLKSSASSLSKKRSLKSLRSIKLNKKSLSSHEVPPVPPIPKDQGNDAETVMISRTPIADKYGRPQNLLAHQPLTEQPQTAPPAISEHTETNPPRDIGTAEEYFRSFPDNMHLPYCPHCHSPRTAPPMPDYPSTPPNIVQNRGWCQPPGWAIHPYHPVSRPSSSPLNYPHTFVRQEHAISDHYPPEMNLSAEENRQTREPPSSQDVKNLAESGRIAAEPLLRSGPMREVRKYEGERYDSVQGEIGRSSHLKNGGDIERDATQTMGKPGRDGRKDLDEEGRLIRNSQDRDKVKDRDSCPQEITKLKPSDVSVKPRSAEGQNRPQDQGLGQKDKLERIVRQYKAEYSDAVKHYKTSGLHQNEKEQAKEKVKRAEVRLKEATQAFREQVSTHKDEEKELKGHLVEAEQGREKLAAKKEAMENAKETSKDGEPLVRKHNFTKNGTNATALPENEDSGLTADQQKMNGHLEDLQKMVEKSQVRYKQAVKIYKSERLSEEEGKAAKEGMKKADMRLKEHMQALQEARNELDGKRHAREVEVEGEGGEGEGDHPLINFKHQDKSDEQDLKRVSEDVEVEDHQMRKSPAGDDVTGRSMRASERGGDREKEELELLVKKYQARHNAALKAYKVDDLTDNQKQDAKKEVVRPQGKLKEAMQALNAFQNSPQKSDGQDANHAKGEDSARKAEDGSTGPDSAAKMKDIKNVSQQGQQITRTPDQDNNKKRKDLEGLVQKYRIRHKELIKAYKAEGLPEEKKKRIREDIKTTEGELKESIQALEAHKTNEKTGAPKTDDSKGGTNPEPSKVEESRPGYAAERDIEGKIRELEKSIMKDQIDYKQAMKSYRQEGSSDDEKREIKDRLKSIESRIKESTRILERLKQTNGITKKNNKIIGQDTKTEISDSEESLKPKLETSSKTSAAESSSSNKSKIAPSDDKVKRLEEMVKQYQIRHKEAVRQVKSEGLTGDQREQAKVSVKRMEVKLKESLQALQNIKAETEADSSQQRKDQIDGVKEKKQDQMAVKGCAGMQSEEPSKAEAPNPHKPRTNSATSPIERNSDVQKLEKQLKELKSSYAEAIKLYKSEQLSEGDKRKAKEKVMYLEQKIKQSQKGLYKIAKNGSASFQKSEKGLEGAETVQKQIKATENWDEALKEYVTTPDMTQGQREEARMKVKTARGEYDDAQRELQMAHEITGSNEPELPEKGLNAQERKGETSEHLRTRDVAQTQNLKNIPTAIARSPASMTSKPKELDEEVSREKPVEHLKKEGATSEGNHQAWAPLRLPSKRLSVPPTPSKSPTRGAVREIQPGPNVAGDITWSKTLISLANCIDLANRILVSLNDSPSPNPITEIVQHLIIGLMMQKDVLLSLKEVVGEESAGMIDEFGEHVAIIKWYVEDLMIKRKEGTLEENGVMRAEKVVEKGSQALAIRKELAVIQRSKEHPKQIEEKKKTEGMIETLDKVGFRVFLEHPTRGDADRALRAIKVLALFSSDHSDTVLVAEAEVKRKRSNLSALTEQQSGMTSFGSMLRKEVKKDKGKKREDYIDVKAEIRPGPADTIENSIRSEDKPFTSIEPTSSSYKLFPISSNSSPMPRSHTPIEEPPSSLSHLMSKISNKLHHSKSLRLNDGKEKEKEKDRKSRPRPIIAPSPHKPLKDNGVLKLPQTTQTFLTGGSSWKRRARPRKISSASLASTSSSFSATVPYTAPLPSRHDRQRSSSGDTTAPSTSYTPESGSSPAGSSPSRYSQTSVDSGSTSTVKSDRLAGELLAQADSGPQAVKHDWRNDLNSSSSGRGRVEADDSQVKRAEDVLYNKVLPVPDTSRGGRRRGDYI
ncbi:hypothetical protein L486_08200 [Kwoniella mangroviensis CBS 10435]|uniref:Uncharacterized protein n=1 Tax=Kwoniella mangroviensis CBS 10435 TaxID=1331196 RepID=A0A1B9IFE7_9TREE|nr:hypothetical protein L486_08200 [Kwoniella mangroviensis CBS 10435]